MWAASIKRSPPVPKKRAFRIYCWGFAVRRNSALAPIEPILAFCLKWLVPDISAIRKSGRLSPFKSAKSAPMENQEV